MGRPCGAALVEPQVPPLQRPAREPRQRAGRCRERHGSAPGNGSRSRPPLGPRISARSTPRGRRRHGGRRRPARCERVLTGAPPILAPPGPGRPLRPAVNRRGGGSVLPGMVRQDERAPFRAGLQRARERAYPPGEYVGQESFLRAGEIRRLADRAGIGPGRLRARPVLRNGRTGPAGRRRSGAAATWAWTPRRARSRSPAASPGTCRAASSRRRSRRCRTAPSTSCSSWRRCWPSPTRRPSWPRWRGARARRPLRLHPRGGPAAHAGRAGRMPDADTVWLVELAELMRTAAPRPG